MAGDRAPVVQEASEVPSVQLILVSIIRDGETPTVNSSR